MQGPSILVALDSQITNKVPRWGGAPGDFSAELWLNQVKMLRTMNKWTKEQTKEACFLSMEGAAALWKHATLRDEGPDALATLAQFKEAFLKRLKKLKTPAESVQLVAQLKQTSAETCLDFYDRCTNSIHEAHEEDPSQLVNQPEARDGYQRAIKQTVQRHKVTGLNSNIKAQISTKLQSLDTNEKLLSTAAEIEVTVQPQERSIGAVVRGPRDISRGKQDPGHVTGDRRNPISLWEPQPSARGRGGRPKQRNAKGSTNHSAATR